MDQLLDKETKTGSEPKATRRKPAKKTLSIPIPEFLQHIGNDVKWYYDVRLWSPLIILLLILALVLPGRGQKAEPTQPTEEIIVQTEPEVTEAPTEPIDPDAVALAVLADTVGNGRSDNVKEVIMWVAVNRSEAHRDGFGKPLQEEISRPEQWQFYDENGKYSDTTYEIAKSVLATQKNEGLRPVDSDMLYLVLNDNGSVTVRDQFLASANNKWQEKTYK